MADQNLSSKYFPTGSTSESFEMYSNKVTGAGAQPNCLVLKSATEALDGALTIAANAYAVKCVQSYAENGRGIWRSLPPLSCSLHTHARHGSVEAGLIVEPLASHSTQFSQLWTSYWEPVLDSHALFPLQSSYSGPILAPRPLILSEGRVWERGQGARQDPIS